MASLSCQPSPERTDSGDNSASPVAAAATIETTPTETPTAGAPETAPLASNAQDAPITASDPNDSQTTDNAVTSEQAATPTAPPDEVDSPLCSEIDLPRSDLATVTPETSDPLNIPEHLRPQPVSGGNRTIAAEYVAQADHDDVALKVTITAPGREETVHILPLGASGELHPALSTRSSTWHIVTAPDRWLIPVSVTTELESLNTLVRGHPNFVSRSLRFDEIWPNWDEHGDAEDVRVTGWAITPDGGERHFSCDVSWDELGITSELYDTYGRPSMENKYRPRIEELSGFIWTARWGEDPVRAELADNRGTCCRIDVLDNGFVAISSTVTSEYSGRESAPIVHFSADGVVWDEVVLPTLWYHYVDVFGPAEVPIWVCSVQSTDTGVLIRESLRDSGGTWLLDGTCDEGTYWSAEKDLTNWRKLLSPPPGYG